VTRVLFVTPRLFSPVARGGGERYVSELARALRVRSDVSLQIAVCRSYRQCFRVVGDNERLEPLSHLELWRMAQRVDVVHVHQLDSPAFDLTAAMSIYGPPVVLTDHGGGWRSVGRMFGHARLRSVSGLAAVSWTSMEGLRWDTQRPWRVLYGGGDHLPAGERPHRSSYDFVFVGRLLEHKGVHLLIEALPEEANCLVVGPPVDLDYLARLQKLAKLKSVEFNLRATDEDVSMAYRSARWCVFPSVSERGRRVLRRPELLGLAPIEARCAGAQIVMSDLPAYAEIAPLIGARIFREGSVEELANMLKSCLSKYDSSTVTASSWRRSSWTWECVAERVMELYGNVVNVPGLKQQRDVWWRSRPSATIQRSTP